VGKDTAKTEHFSFSVGDIGRLSCLKKWNIPSKVEFANTVKIAIRIELQGELIMLPLSAPYQKGKSFSSVLLSVAITLEM
jgi:hypothetical protein